MKIKLEYDDGLVFGTFHVPGMNEYRALVVKINGKPFTVWRTLESHNMYINEKEYLEEIDKILVKSMERVFEKLFLDACAAVPEGTDLLTDREGR